MITMGTEALSHRDRFKRTIASGMLLAGVSSGIGLTQESVASASTRSQEISQSQEVSTKVPTAEKFFQSLYGSFVRNLNRIVPNDKDKIVNAPTINIGVTKPFEWDPGVMLSGKDLSIVSKDKTIKLVAEYTNLTSTNGDNGKSHVIERVFGISLYVGTPKEILSNLTDNSAIEKYSLVINTYNDQKNLSFYKLGFNLIGSESLPFYYKFGTALNSIDSQRKLTSSEMIKMKALLLQTEDLMKGLAHGDTIRIVGKYDGYPAHRLVSYKHK
jgi:hypothetical protein